MHRMILTCAAMAMQISVAAACSCPRPSLEELIESSRDIAVLSARVVSVLSPEKGKPAVVRLIVEEVIKGEAPRVIEMTGITPADDPCGVDFRPGEARTLAAYKQGGRWRTDICHVPRL